MTVLINVLVPPLLPFISPPGRLSSDLSGPGLLLQGYFLQTNPLALGNEGCLQGHSGPKHTTQPTNFWDSHLMSQFFPGSNSPESNPT